MLSSDGSVNKIIIFATNKMFERLSTASALYMDGTFKSYPALFYQLFTVNIFVRDQQVSAVYMLLPRKSTQIYDRAFLSLMQTMLERDFECEPLEILVDYEISL